MQNAVHSLLDLFKLSAFCIPQYQRAYAWAEPQLVSFVEDLRQQTAAQRGNSDKSYYLGTLLLHEEGKNINIVDGQQRLTTSVIFVAAALKRHKDADVLAGSTLKPELLYRNFIHDKDEDLQKFRTIAEDNLFFRQHVLGLDTIVVTEDSPSSLRLKNAMDHFLTHIKDDEWTGLVNALVNANVMVYSVQNHGDATLIFELQNDRGKKLTDLEALKSYLMHLIYLNAKNHDVQLEGIQSQFSKIYRHIEQLSKNKSIPKEDAILTYHCAAYLAWTDDEWRNPKDLVKSTLKLVKTEDIPSWVATFVSGLHESYKTFVELYANMDRFEAFTHLVLLNRMGSFWPMILKAYRMDKTADKQHFAMACRLMEVYAMRGYGMSNLRSDAGMTSLYREARSFDGKDFIKLHDFLHSMSSWYDVDNRFKDSLDHPSIYRRNRSDVQYLLWRYENKLRAKSAKKAEFLSWKQYLHPRDDGSSLSIEHIAAQNNPISKQDVEWVKGEIKKFEEVATHRLGNLVLDTKSANSSKGKSDFTDKLESLSTNSTFLSQGELVRWANSNESGVREWTLDSVKKRHEDLKNFALTTWDPDTYHKVKQQTPEEPMETDLPETAASED